MVIYLICQDEGCPTDNAYRTREAAEKKAAELNGPEPEFYDAMWPWFYIKTVELHD